MEAQHVKKKDEHVNKPTVGNSRHVLGSHHAMQEAQLQPCGRESVKWISSPEAVQPGP
jgi:hypothetical protein